MRFALLLLLAGTACDSVFSVDHVDPLHPKGIDAAIDATDAKACLPFDEDCDDVPNATDFCPADAENNTDTDADGVGDICDPDSALERNRIALFDGFDDTTGGWTIKTGNWQVANGVFKQLDIADTGFEKSVSLRYPWMEVIVPDYTLVGNGSITAFGSIGGSDLQCTVFRRAIDGVEFLSIDGFWVMHSEMAIPGTGTLRIVGGQRQNGVFYCRARHASSFDVELTSGMTNPVTIDKVGVTTSSASATISSITLYDVP